MPNSVGRKAVPKKNRSGQWLAIVSPACQTKFWGQKFERSPREGVGELSPRATPGGLSYRTQSAAFPFRVLNAAFDLCGKHEQEGA
jgi:hypothetical protein